MDPVLRLRDASFAYRGADRPALSGIDLDCARGQLVVILGPSGAGTSTLCRLIAGLLGERGHAKGRVDSGGAIVMIGDDPEAQLSGMTSRVLDEVQLPGRLAGREPGESRARAAVALVSLGIEDLGQRSVDRLSGGQRQLVALAGALAAEPAVLVLDQPGLSLDPGARGRLAEGLRAHAARGGGGADRPSAR